MNNMWSVKVLVILLLVLFQVILFCDHAQALGVAHVHIGARHVSRVRIGGLRRFGRRHYGFGYRKQARRGYTWGPPGPRNAGRRRRPAGSLVVLGGVGDFFLWPYGR